MSMIRFQAYFKKGLRYLSGGVKTGLSHYVEDKNPKLFHVKVIVSIFTITNIKLKSICQYIKILQHPMHVPSIVIVIVCMFMVQGRRKPIVRQCMEISWAVMNRCRSPPCSTSPLNLAGETLMCWTCRCQTRC